MNTTDEFPLPEWAQEHNYQREPIVGAQLFTKDSSRMGNARIVDIEFTKDMGYLWHVRTDMGNQMKLTYSELLGAFTVGPYIMKDSELTARKEVIRTCRQCRHQDHKGAFGNPSCVPCCRHPAVRRDDGLCPELPHTLSEGEPTFSGEKRFHATPTHVIPSWCPLEFN